jgi:DNA (cytosine-5)-methyltransferase 1
MGFDRPSGRSWNIPVSDNQAYQQFGNAVVPGVVSRIALPIAEAIAGAARKQDLSAAA